MANRFVNPVPQQSNSAGNPLLDAEYNFYTDGTLTTRKDTFADANETILNANPLPLDGDGRTPNIFYDGTATVQLTNDTGTGQTQVWRRDGVGAFGTGSAFDVWNPVTEYETDALVQGSDGEYYRSLQDNNSANDPISSPTFWELIEFLRTWNANVTYAATNTAKGSDGLIYRSLAGANINNDPTSTTGFWGAPIEFRVQDDLYFIDSELTISSGSVAATKSHHTIDTEADAATDDLDTITVAGVNDGTLLFLRLENATRVVTLKHNTGNIQLKDGLDIVMEAGLPTVLLRVGTDWEEIDRPNQLTKPSFLATRSSTDSNVTGNGAVYTVDFDVDQYDLGGNHANGVFTCTVAGPHFFEANVQFSQLVSASTFLLTLSNVTTGDGYTLGRETSLPDGSVNKGGSKAINLAVGDTVSILASITGMAGDTADLTGDATTVFRTSWSGFLI